MNTPADHANAVAIRTELPSPAAVTGAIRAHTDELIGRLDRAYEALKKYGEHEHDCPSFTVANEDTRHQYCTCGYAKALEALRQS